MIPYFEGNIRLGSITLQAFGLFFALGFASGVALMIFHGRRRGLPARPFIEGSVWAVLGGVFTGHWAHLFLYHPEELARSAWQPLVFWQGMSSLGGVVGGVAALLLYFLGMKLKARTYTDSVALGITPGWGVARIGCFLVHDHPGIPSQSFLAVKFSGGPRLDLGLIDALVLFGLTALLWVLDARGKLRGQLAFVLAIGYGSCRFVEDFFRAYDLPYHDARYGGLTPGQYVCMLLVAAGAALLAFTSRTAPENIPPPATSP